MMQGFNRPSFAVSSFLFWMLSFMKKGGERRDAKTSYYTPEDKIGSQANKYNVNVLYIPFFIQMYDCVMHFYEHINHHHKVFITIYKVVCLLTN